MTNFNRMEKILDKSFFEIFDSFGNISRSRYIREPLSECDIIELQEKFLSRGVSHIAVERIEFGRELVKKFLSSIRCYHENAVLSICPEACQSLSSREYSFTDIYDDLLSNGCINGSRGFGQNNSCSFNDFLFEQFFYDFLFIEACQELIDSDWFLEFFSALKDCEIDKQIPIIIISCEK